MAFQQDAFQNNAFQIEAGNTYYKSCAGVLSFSGTLGTSILLTKSLTGVLSFVGGLSRKTYKRCSGVLSFSGTLLKHSYKTLTGVLSFSGGLKRSTSKKFTGELDFTGTLGTSVTIGKTNYGVLNFVGSLARKLIGKEEKKRKIIRPWL